VSPQSAMLIGIDVGYSKNRPTCGVASTRSDLGHELGGIVKLDGLDVPSVYVGKYRIDDLEPALRRLAAAKKLDGAVCVLDGPLGGIGPPTVHRRVDAACMRGAFRDRAVPASVCGGGRALVDATYRIARAIVGYEHGRAYRLTPRRDEGVGGPQLFETHPTIGLAILTPMLPTSEIPNRRKKAKSDFYWEDRRAGDRVEAVIGIPGIGRVSDHEYRAALYSLAVASQIAGSAADRSAAIAVGKAEPAEDSGIYVLLGPADPSWRSAVSGVGIVT
jgi:hypothetical protein